MSSLLLVLYFFAGGDVDAAEKALEAGKPKEAIALLGELAQSEDPRANAVLGRAYYALREYGNAIEPLITASDGIPDDGALARDAAYACWGAAEEADRKGMRQDARAHYHDALRMARRWGDASMIARMRKKTGDFEGALEDFRKLEDSLSNRIHIAECLDGLGREEQAKKAWGAALEEAIRSRDLQKAYQSASAAKRFGPLIGWLNRELKDAPENVWYRMYRGFAYANTGLWHEAVDDLRFAVERRPDDNVKRELAYALYRLGVQEQRAEALEESRVIGVGLIERDREDKRARNLLLWLAQYAWLNRDVPRTYEILKHLYGVLPDDRDVSLNYANMARRLGHYDEGQAVYDAMLRDDPEDPTVLTDLGILHDARGDRAKAVETWKRVLREDPEDMNALENLLTAAWERGDTAAAAQYVKRGLAVASEAGGGLWVRWNWFSDRLGWAPKGHGG